MDNNQFTLDDLLKSNKFIPNESRATVLSYNEMLSFLQSNVLEKDVSDEIECFAAAYGNCNFDDGFKQGFCFAVRTIKFLMKM